VVLDAALGDVVQEQRDVEQLAVPWLNRAHQLGGELGVLAAAGVDVGEDADAAQQMLVDGVVVYMLNCIIATMRPKAGTKRPSTPASFIRRSTVSASFFEVRISRNSWFASSFSRSS